MTADKFVEIVRKGSDKLRVDDVLLKTPDREVHGKGMLRIERERIAIDFTLNRGETLPPFSGGVFTVSDFWKLSGVIEDHLHFKCANVGPGPSPSWSNGVSTITFSLNPIELIPSGWDAMSPEDRKRALQQLAATTATKPEPFDEPNDETEARVSVQFHAVLADYPLIGAYAITETRKNNSFLGVLGSSKADTLIGEIDGYDYALIEGESDTHMHMRSKKDYRSPNDENDWNSFQALLFAMAFTHGRHAWPYRIEYWRDGKKITDRVTAAQRLPRTLYAPFNKGFSSAALAGLLEWDIRNPLNAATAFFAAKTSLSDAVTRILHLFREAGDDGTNFDITTLTFCSLFEALVQVLFKELGLKQALLENESVKLFEQAKMQMLTDIAPKVAAEVAARSPSELIGGYRRLERVISSAYQVSAREMFYALVVHFGLQWQDDMEKVFTTWAKARHPLVHEARAGETEPELKQSTISRSRIAAAINILILKLIGYSGPARQSVVEDADRRI